MIGSADCLYYNTSTAVDTLARHPPTTSLATFTL